MMTFFDINNICTTLLGYRLCYLELAAVVTGLAAVGLAARGKVVNFYIGLINNILYFLLFFQYQLYSAMLLQIIYFCISSYGIVSWSLPDKAGDRLKITTLSNRMRILLITIILVVGIVWGKLVISLAGTFAGLLDKPAYPYIDAILTVASIVGQILLTRKKIDNWSLWTVVNVCSIVLYATVGIYFTAILYVVYLGVAIHALFKWRKDMI
ncbi:MAG: nicotinamide riboside transporter PnuC [Prevotellaceae bacterium]|jgi:nicotinamide mononucleotide transporter|nr:nicotinamide riboside transporter PnuC [Prevotellaceae bacterium]